MFKKLGKQIFGNILTSLAGSVAGIPVIMQGVQSHNTQVILAGVGALLIGLFSKDGHN